MSLASERKDLKPGGGILEAARDVERRCYPAGLDMNLRDEEQSASPAVMHADAARCLETGVDRPCPRLLLGDARLRRGPRSVVSISSARARPHTCGRLVGARTVRAKKLDLLAASGHHAI